MIIASVLVHAPRNTPAPSDFLLYVFYPTVVLGIAALGAFIARLGSRLSTQDRALSLLIQEVTPPGQPSLRTMVMADQTDTALIKQRQNDRWDYVKSVLAELQAGKPPTVDPPP